MDTYEFRNPVVRDHFDPKEKPLQPKHSIFWMVVLCICALGFFFWTIWRLL